MILHWKWPYLIFFQSEDLLLIDAFYVVINITTQLVRKNLWVQMASNAAHMYEATRKNTANFTAILKQVWIMFIVVMVAKIVYYASFYIINGFYICLLMIYNFSMWYDDGFIILKFVHLSTLLTVSFWFERISSLKNQVWLTFSVLILICRFLLIKFQGEIERYYWNNPIQCGWKSEKFDIKHC